MEGHTHNPRPDLQWRLLYRIDIHLNYINVFDALEIFGSVHAVCSAPTQAHTRTHTQSKVSSGLTDPVIP